MPPTARRPTIDDVAAAAGVSRGTVSRVLNGGRYASAASSAAVEAAVAATGYVVNSSARSLVTSRSGAVALVITEPQDRLFEDPSFPVLLRSATEALAERDLVLMLLLAGTAPERDRVLRFLRGAHVDGALLVGVRAGDPLLEEAGRTGVPVVTSGHLGGAEVGPCSVAADDRGGARSAVEHLRSRGRRRITTVAGPPDTHGGGQRLAGFHDVLGHRADGADAVAAEDWTHAAGERAATRLLAQAPDLDAVFAASDVLASGVLAALHRAGRDVPADVAVVGFDDARVAVQLDPPLTTVRQPLAEVGRRMVDLLAAQLAGEEVSSVVLPTELVVRASS